MVQERMDHIPERCTGTMGIADDVAVFGKDEKKHFANLHIVKKIAQQEGLVTITNATSRRRRCASLA